MFQHLKTNHFIYYEKIVLIAAIAVCGMFSANAQETSFGVKAGVNLANLNTDADIDGKTSFYLGAVAEFGLSESFALQPELVYSMQGADELDLSYINIPVLAKYYLVEGLAVEVGPQFGFVVDDEDTEAESIDFSAAIGAEYVLDMGVFFQARYNLGLTDVYDGIDSKNSVFQIGLGYKF